MIRQGRALLACIGGMLIVLGLSLGPVGTATANGPGDQVCSGLDSGKIDTTGDPSSVTVTAPDGKLIDRYCVKAGSSGQGDGPVYVDVDPPQKTVTISYPTGKAVSHYSVSYTDAPSDEPEGSNNSSSPTCEKITVGTPTDIKPEGATVAVWLNGEVTLPGTYDVEPGYYTVKTLVNGVVVDEDEVVVKKCDDTPPPTEPEGKVVLVSNTCETVTFSVTDIKPEDATVVVKLDDVNTLPGTYDVDPGQHTVELWVDGTKVDSKTISVEECETPPPSPTSVTPDTPSATQPNCEQPDMTVTPGSQPGVVWTPVGTTVLEPGESVTYVAAPAEGYEFPEDAQTSWSFTNTFDSEACDEEEEPTPVSPTEPTSSDVCEPATGATNDRITIPTDANFTYQVDGKDVVVGPFVATGTSHTVKAIAKEGVVVKEGTTTEWTFTFTKVKCVTATETPTPTPPTGTPTPTETPTPTVGPPSSTSVPTPTSTPSIRPPDAGAPGGLVNGSGGDSAASFTELLSRTAVVGGFALLGLAVWPRRRKAIV